MRIQVVPFSHRHVADAARLLADRHRRERTRTPELPAAFEDDSAALVALRDAGARWATRGVAVMVNGQLRGYLLGTLEMIGAGNTDVGNSLVHSATIRVAGHAVSEGGAFELYGEMYASLSGTWPKRGSHTVDVIATDTDALGAWFALGFGQQSVLAVRGTSRVTGAGFDRSVEFRRADLTDLATVLRFHRELERHYQEAPMFHRAVASTDPDRRSCLARSLSDSKSPTWIAWRNDHPLGMVCLQDQPPADPLVMPAQSVSVSQCFTVPEARGLGIALLRHALGWARSEGYERCTATWLTANLLSARTCTALGFRPLQYRLSRTVNDCRLGAG
jgi:GNAT superfamily N-acetyltransferase